MDIEIGMAKIKFSKGGSEDRVFPLSRQDVLIMLLKSESKFSEDNSIYGHIHRASCLI